MPDFEAVASVTRMISKPILGSLLLLPLLACATKPQVATRIVPPAATTLSGTQATIAAIRPESSAQDPTGSLQQVMSILGRNMVPPANAAEIILHMSDNTYETITQPAATVPAMGSQVLVSTTPITRILSD